jgi:hypothetical protein
MGRNVPQLLQMKVKSSFSVPHLLHMLKIAGKNLSNAALSDCAFDSFPDPGLGALGFVGRDLPRSIAPQRLQDRASLATGEWHTPHLPSRIKAIFGFSEGCDLAPFPIGSGGSEIGFRLDRRSGLRRTIGVLQLGQTWALMATGEWHTPHLPWIISAIFGFSEGCDFVPFPMERESRLSREIGVLQLGQTRA